jgi:hypothetical protein
MIRKPISVLYKYEGWGLGHRYAYTPPHETLAITSSQPNPEALAAHKVMAHLRAMFHPCTCGLYGGAATVATALISYDYHEEETIMIDYLLYTNT